MGGEPIIRIATHDGAFHADDVLAVAVLSTVFKNHQIIRSRDPGVLSLADITVDVGGLYDHETRQYDHHMANPPTDGQGHILSSAGLIWYHYATAYLRAIGIPKQYTYRERTIDLIGQVDKIIQTRWIYPIDRCDNGVSSGPTPISELVSSIGPTNMEKSREKFDSAFLEVVSIVSHLFERACFHALDYSVSKLQYTRSDKEKFADGKILVAETDVRNFGNFSNTETHFVIYPTIDYSDGVTHYTIRPIYETVSKGYKTPFPSDLLGLNRVALHEQGHTGLSFVHHSGFMAKAADKDSAVKFCLSLVSI